MKYNYIAIEGNIGVGKSTLAQLLAAHYGATLVPEEFTGNTFLPKFYQDPGRYAFPLELSFLADRYKQLHQLITTNSFSGQKVIADYTLAKCKLFAKVNLEGDEYELFEKLYDIIARQVPVPDLLIYLLAPVPILQQKIRLRGRMYEQHIPDSYLQQVEGVYQAYVQQGAGKTLIIDTAAVDFINIPAHFEQLVAFLDADTAFHTHQLVIV